MSSFFVHCQVVLRQQLRHLRDSLGQFTGFLLVKTFPLHSKKKRECRGKMMRCRRLPTFAYQSASEERDSTRFSVLSSKAEKKS